jgi:hypothetical protein
MILFYEDERYFIEDYLTKLIEAGYTVEVYDKAKEFLIRVNQVIEIIDVFILDIMVFGTGNELLKSRSYDGYQSGIAIIERIETIEKKRGLHKKKIVFTNRDGEFLNRLKNNKRITAAISKADYLPSEFAKFVNNIINEKK